MPGNKYRSKFKKSRKGFKGKPSWETLGNEEQVSRPPRPIFVPTENDVQESLQQDLPVNDTGNDSSNTQMAPRNTVPSKRKLEAHSSSTLLTTKRRKCPGAEEESNSEKKDGTPKGYRIVNMKTLGQAVTEIHKCSKGRCLKKFALFVFAF